MINLEPITAEKFYQVLNLQVQPEQAKFVATNEKSLAECYLYRHNDDVSPFGITVQGEVVGFLLLDSDLEKRELMIWRMMIGANFQGKGYGKQVVLKVIGLAEENQEYDILIADYVKGNQQMARLLSSLGFVKQSFNEQFNEYVCHYNLL